MVTGIIEEVLHAETAPPCAACSLLQTHTIKKTGPGSCKTLLFFFYHTDLLQRHFRDFLESTFGYIS